MPILLSSSSGLHERPKIDDFRRCFDNGLHRVEVATGYEHGAGPTTYLVGLMSGLGVSSEVKNVRL